jgi:hypothetical protein
LVKPKKKLRIDIVYFCCGPGNGRNIPRGRIHNNATGENTMPDYLPRTDAEFDRWFERFIEYSGTHGGELGLSGAEIAELRAMRNAWGASFARHQAAQETARNATVMKEMTRVASEQVLRKYVRVIQARPSTTNDQRRGMGITVKPDALAARGPAPLPIPQFSGIDCVSY